MSQAHNRISTETLLADLRQLAAELGRSPRATDVIAWDLYSHTTYYERFGDHLTALQEAEIPLDPEQQAVLELREGRD